MPRRRVVARALWVSLVAAGLCIAAGRLGVAQTPAQKPSSSAGVVFVLVPYGEPGTKDPHADGETEALEADLKAAGIATAMVAPIDHLRAVAGAVDLCRQNAAAGLLIAEGRYEQTEHTSMIPVLPVQVSKYPSHVELRLDEIDCRSTVVWSAHATGDQTVEGANFGFSTAGNVGSAIDTGFRNATAVVVVALTKAPAPNPTQMATSPVPAQSSASSASASNVYLLVPFEQPDLADPRAPDITHSLAAKFQERHLVAKIGSPIDRLTAVATAPALCSGNGATAIVVPSIRLEQTKRSHAELRLDLLDCNGQVVSSAVSEADIGLGLVYGGKAMIKVAEDAMDPALDQLFSPQPKQ
jgi:hypothetical protein